MAKISVKSLLEAGAHFGHQTRRWNPKMKPYIFGNRGDIYILDLKQTLVGLDQAYTFVENTAAKGGTVLFVGTKKQAQEAIATQADRCGMPYINARWLGGMLTNFVTIRSRVQRMEELEAMESDGRMEVLPKKEQILLKKELAKLQTNLNGIRNMKKLPDAIFVVDTNREQLAIHEAKRLGIPVVGTLDTNCDPDDIDYVNTHGTSTPVGDLAEVAGIVASFGDHVYDMNISSTKSMTGHLLGAAGAIEGLACIMAITKGIVPPTINVENLDPKIDPKINLTLNKAQKRDVKYALSNTFGFGGHNSTVVFKKI